MKTYTHDEVYEATLAYFNADTLATDVWISKYALRDKQGNLLELTPRDMHCRIANELARIEQTKFKNPLTAEEILGYLDHFRYIVPAGSAMFGIGNNNQFISLSNCFALPSPHDNYSSILEADEHLVQVSKRRGGVGINLSNLRPAGTPVQNAARTSSGVVSFAKRYSHSIREVAQEGRRGALLLVLNVHHPEVVAFAKSKEDLKELVGANISIFLTDEFMEAVQKNTTYEQRWPVDAFNPTISQRVKARDIWDEIVTCARNTAEPGLLFYDTIVRESPADCYEYFKTIVTNPCAEQPLSAYGSCILLSINLFSYVDNPFTDKAEYNFIKLHEHAKIAQRLIDDIIDLEIKKIDKIIAKINDDPESYDLKRREKVLWESIRYALTRGRRTGVGITGLADAMAGIGIKYGDKDSIKFVDIVYDQVKKGCYHSSQEIAKEIGTFPDYDGAKEKDNPFLSRHELLGPRRNIACLTTAPTGSLSILTQTSSGIEPQFKLTYTRRRKINPSDKETQVDFVDQSGDKWQEYEVVVPKLKIWMEITGNQDITKSPWYNCCAEDLDWKDRVAIQATAQNHVDAAISSTINTKEDITVEEVSKIYMTAWKLGLKGITIYRKNSRTGVLIDNKSETISKTIAPKRPKELPCNVRHVTVFGEEYLVLIGLLSGEPYEVFALKNSNVPKSIEIGSLIKVKRGEYKAVLEHEHTIENIMEKSKPEEEAITRLVSTALRHGSSVDFVVHQLEKSRDRIESFSKAIARALKREIKEGAKIYGDECPNCGAELVRSGGCPTCMSGCGWSQCS